MATIACLWKQSDQLVAICWHLGDFWKTLATFFRPKWSNEMILMRFMGCFDLKIKNLDTDLLSFCVSIPAFRVLKMAALFNLAIINKIDDFFEHIVTLATIAKYFEFEIQNISNSGLLTLRQNLSNTFQIFRFTIWINR